MTKNAAAKKSVREFARAHGMSYTAAQRRLSADSPEGTCVANPASGVVVTYEFVGAGAPAPVRPEVSAWLDRLDRYDIDMLRATGWAHDPSVPEIPQLPDFLTFAVAASADPSVRSAAAWVAAKTRPWEASFIAPDPDSYTGQSRIFEGGTTYPYRVVFDADAAEEWVARRRWVHDLFLGDLITPAERWEWMAWHSPGEINCAAGRHFFDASPSPYAGECFGCGAMMLGKYTYDGEEYQDIVGEEEFFTDAVESEAACNWAPPSAMLNGETQSDWHRRNRQVVWA